MNRFAVSMSIFLVLTGAGAFLAYRSGISTYEAKEAAIEKAAEEAEKAKEAQTEAATTGEATGSNGEGKASETEVQVSGNVKNGETIYGANCLGCHQAGGVGGVGPKLAKADATKWTLNEFKVSLIEGKTPTKVLAATMPRWAGGFGGSGKAPTDQEIADLHSYLKSL